MGALVQLTEDHCGEPEQTVAPDSTWGRPPFAFKRWDRDGSSLVLLLPVAEAMEVAHMVLDHLVATTL